MPRRSAAPAELPRLSHGLTTFCLPSSPPDVAAMAHQLGLLPRADDPATSLAAAAVYRSSAEGLEGILLPYFSTDPLDELGICALWQASTPDVDYERGLLLRALLEALPHNALVLPPNAATVADVPLAPLRVGAILEAVRERRRVDLTAAEFRWDAPPPRPRGGGAAAGGRRAWGGMSKAQLELCAYETVLLALDERDAPPRAEAAAALRAIGAQLGVGKEARAVVALPLLRLGQCASAVERCGLGRRLAYLLEMTPFDFATDNAFFEWQARQAALLGASLHSLLGGEIHEALHALVDALCMELLATARPTPDSTVLRRSRGFPEEQYRNCVRRVEHLYGEVLKQVVEEAGVEACEAVVNQKALPPEMATRVYLMILSTRFDQGGEPGLVVPESREICRVARLCVAPALCLCEAEHHACMLHSALCELHAAADEPVGALLPLLPSLAWPLHRMARALRTRAGKGGAARCALLVRPLALLLLQTITRLFTLCGEEDLQALAAAVDLFFRLLALPRRLIEQLGIGSVPWGELLEAGDVSDTSEEEAELPSEDEAADSSDEEPPAAAEEPPSPAAEDFHYDHSSSSSASPVARRMAEALAPPAATPRFSSTRSRAPGENDYFSDELDDYAPSRRYTASSCYTEDMFEEVEPPRLCALLDVRPPVACLLTLSFGAGRVHAAVGVVPPAEREPKVRLAVFVEGKCPHALTEAAKRRTAAFLGQQADLAAARALSLAASKHHEEALLVCHHGLLLQPKHLLLLKLKADSLLALGEDQKAVGAYQDALRLEPGNEALQSGMLMAIRLVDARREQEEDEEQQSLTLALPESHTAARRSRVSLPPVVALSTIASRKPQSSGSPLPLRPRAQSAAPPARDAGLASAPPASAPRRMSGSDAMDARAKARRSPRTSTSDKAESDGYSRGKSDSVGSKSSATSGDSERLFSKKLPPPPALAAAPMLAFSSCLELSCEVLFDRLCEHAATAEEQSTGCAFLANLTRALLPPLVMLLERQAPVIERAASRMVRPDVINASAWLSRMCNVLVELLHAHIEIHAHTAELGTERSTELLPLLTCVEGVIQKHKVPNVRPRLLVSRAIMAMFDRWVVGREQALPQMCSRVISCETWTPVTEHHLISHSVADLFQLFSQTTNFFLSVIQPSVAMLVYLDRLLEAIFNATLSYVEEISLLAGSASDLTKYSFCPPHVKSPLDPLPKAVANHLEAQSTFALATMLNNLYACAERLERLWDDIERSLREYDFDVDCLQRPVLKQALQMIKARCDGMVEFMAHRLVFWEMRSELAVNLYAKSVASPPQQMAAIIAPLLSEKQAELVRMIDPTHAEEMVLAVLVASCDAYERVLLDGGRSFTFQDGQLLEEELETLIDVFLLDLNNSSGCKLNPEVVDAVAARIRSVVGLFKLSVPQLVRLYRGEPLTNPATPVAPRRPALERAPSNPFVGGGRERVPSNPFDEPTSELIEPADIAGLSELFGEPAEPPPPAEARPAAAEGTPKGKDAARDEVAHEVVARDVLAVLLHRSEPEAREFIKQQRQQESEGDPAASSSRKLQSQPSVKSMLEKLRPRQSVGSNSRSANSSPGVGR
ncbi:hypothetical protein AB1Y20_006404 [Prymnesium parvum]|uniref:MHD2 domain-containing protein n=1 Tax=Prymnesium parvum TaxID=97485 RepID=A0AB34J4N0_PRYPA